MVLSLKVRPARHADAGAMAEILNAIVRTGGTTAIQSILSDAEMIEWFIESPRVYCSHVALHSGHLIGFQTVNRDDHLPALWGEMATFAAQGQTARGIGTALFAATVAAARARGLAHLNAKIRADNSGGLAYYSRMGFADHHVDRGVPLADGTPVDRVSKRFEL